MKYCLGTVQFGMNYGIQNNGQPNTDHVKTILEYACSNGIDTLDTAAAYGTAEKVLGEVLETSPTKFNRMNIVSKLDPRAFDECDSAEWGKIAVQKAKESMKRLKVDKLKAYLFHNAAYIFNEQAVNALAEVRAQGLSECIGVSVYTPEEAMKALEYDQVKAVQVPYNVLDQRLERCHFFEKAKEKNVIVFARSSLLQGLLMMDPGNLPEKVRIAENTIREYLNICDKYECTPLKGAVGYVCCNPYVDYVVFGVDNLLQLQEYLSIQEWVMPDDMLQEFKRVFQYVEEKIINPSLWGK